MTAIRVFVFAVLLALGLGVGPVVGTASAHHSCVDQVPCYPHVDVDPKAVIMGIGDTLRCLILAQPPTACL